MKNKIKQPKTTGPKTFGPQPRKPGPDYKLRKKLKRMFRKNYDGK